MRFKANDTIANETALFFVHISKIGLEMLYKQNKGDSMIFDKGTNQKKVGGIVNVMTGRGRATKDPDLNRKISAMLFSLRLLTARMEIATTPVLKLPKYVASKVSKNVEFDTNE